MTFNYRVILGMFLFTALASAVPETVTPWVFSGVENGVVLHHRTLPGSNILALKGEGNVDAPVWKLASILLDLKRAPEWVDSLAESRLVRRVSPNSYIEYNYINTVPIIMKDRDFVSLVTVEVDQKGKSLTLNYQPSSEPFKVEGKNPIRGEIIEAHFRLFYRSPQQTRVVGEFQADPKGGVPKWVVNLFQKSWPRNTFNRLTVQAAKNDIEIPKDFKELIEPTKQFLESTRPEQPRLAD